MRVLARLRRGLLRYGVAGTARRSLVLARETAIGFRQELVWYELPLRDERPRRQLEPPLRLVEGDSSHLPLLDRLWVLDRTEGERRLGGVGTLWLVLDGEAPAFSCWTFRGRTPVRAAAGRWLDLPEDTACLEESMTAATHRGRSVAPAAWSAIADRLAAEPGLRRLVTAVESENAASRRAVGKAGFREIGRSVLVRRGRRERVSADGEGEAGAFLRALER